MVIEKPPGIAVHDSSNPHAGLISQLRQSKNCQALYLCHRLDLVTSGLLLIAKNTDSNRVLSQCFQRGEVEKYYVAISDRKPSKKQGSVRGDMVKARGGSWRLTRDLQNPAKTSFLSFTGPQIESEKPALRHFILKPLTGKTHQLRVALKSLGAPILGDDRYGGSLADRTYLHAAQLAFDYGGESYRFVCPPGKADHFDESFHDWFDSLPPFESFSWGKQG